MIRILITLGVLYWLLHSIPLSGIGAVLRSAELKYVALGLILPFLMRFTAASRIKIIAEAQGLSLSREIILKTLYASSFYALFLPGSIAAGAATWMKYVQHGARSGPAFTLIFLNRITELMTVIVLGLTYWLIDHFIRGPLAILVFAGAIALFALTYTVLLRSTPYVSIGIEFVARHRRLRESWLHRKLAAFATHLARMHDLPRAALARVLGASIVQDLLGAMVFFSFARALDLELDFVTVAWMRAVTYILALLPISIAGLGVREGMLVFLTAPYGIAPAAAVAWSLLIFMGGLLAGLAGGLLEAQALWNRRV